jgi:N-acetylglucosaminyldiphosphoundecaprenol N-acetyl-beta-D-mannosaminyltransferase
VTRSRVLGVPVDSVALDDAVNRLEQWITNDHRSYVCLANVHVIESARRSPSLLEALERAGLVLPDGAPVAWALSRRLRTPVHRVTGAGLLEELCRRSARGQYSHYFVGATDETLSALSRALLRRHPSLDVRGTWAPPFRPLSVDEEKDLAARLNAASPQVIWIGVGAPKQELWMLSLRRQVNAPLLIGVGAVFDFASGNKTRAPIWMQAAGLEWAHRLMTEPRRLWRRYLTTNTTFLIALARERLTP